MSNVTEAVKRLEEFRSVLLILGQKENAAMLDRPIELLTDQRPLSFVAGDATVSHYKDEAGVWTHLELTEEVEGEDEWRTVASLLLSDVEAADLARRLTDRGTPS